MYGKGMGLVVVRNRSSECPLSIDKHIQKGTNTEEIENTFLFRNFYVLRFKVPIRPFPTFFSCSSPGKFLELLKGKCVTDVRTRRHTNIAFSHSIYPLQMRSIKLKTMIMEIRNHQHVITYGLYHRFSHYQGTYWSDSQGSETTHLMT